MAQLNIVTASAIALVGSYIVADTLGFDLFTHMFSFLLQMFLYPFAFFVNITGPYMKKAAQRDGFSFLVRVWLFAVDCAIAGTQSLLVVLDKLGNG